MPLKFSCLAYSKSGTNFSILPKKLNLARSLTEIPFEGQLLEQESGYFQWKIQVSENKAP